LFFQVYCLSLFYQTGAQPYKGTQRNMSSSSIKKIGEALTFEKAIDYIESLPLELSLIREMSTERLWRVENHKEFSYISVCYKSLVTGMAQVGIICKK
jgi:hypothetical protein